MIVIRRDLANGCKVISFTSYRTLCLIQIVKQQCVTLLWIINIYLFLFFSLSPYSLSFPQSISRSILSRSFFELVTCAHWPVVAHQSISHCWLLNRLCLRSRCARSNVKSHDLTVALVNFMRDCMPVMRRRQNNRRHPNFSTSKKCLHNKLNYANVCIFLFLLLHFLHFVRARSFFCFLFILRLCVFVAAAMEK